MYRSRCIELSRKCKQRWSFLLLLLDWSASWRWRYFLYRQKWIYHVQYKILKIKKQIKLKILNKIIITCMFSMKGLESQKKIGPRSLMKVLWAKLYNLMLRWLFYNKIFLIFFIYFLIFGTKKFRVNCCITQRYFHITQAKKSLSHMVFIT